MIRKRLALRRLALIAGSLLLPLALVSGGVYWAMYQVPDFYRAALAEVPPDPVVRKRAAREFVKHTLDLVDSIQNADHWSETFEQEQINSWLVEELHDPRYKGLVPRGVSNPRVLLRENLVLVGFHVAQKRWDGIVSIRIRPWVPQPNQLALEVQSVKVGLIPYPLDEVLEDVTIQLAEEGLRSEWQQMDGNDVLLVHLDRGDPEKSPVLEAIQVAEGEIRISGRGRTPRDQIRIGMAGLPRQSARK
jgi:hypothetical protein